MKNFLITLFTGLLFLFVLPDKAQSQTAEYPLQNLTIVVSGSSAIANFTPANDPALSYEFYIEYTNQVGATNANTYVLEGKPGKWMKAAGWFNPTGNAFWDGRATSIGPPAVCIAFWNVALAYDGRTQNGCIAVYRKGTTTMDYLGASQTVAFKSPTLVGSTVTSTSTSTTTTPTSTTTTTTTVTSKVTGPKKPVKP